MCPVSLPGSTYQYWLCIPPSLACSESLKRVVQVVQRQCDHKRAVLEEK